MKHIYNKSLHGGYFYRVYPNISPPVGSRSDKDLFSNLPNGIVNPPEASSPTIVRHSFHGEFMSKETDSYGFYIELLTQAEITFLDTTIDEVEVRNLSSVVKIEVSEKIYRFEFIERNIYIITFSEVISYGRNQRGGNRTH